MKDWPQQRHFTSSKHETNPYPTYAWTSLAFWQNKIKKHSKIEIFTDAKKWLIVRMFVKNGTIVHFSATGKCILIMTYNIAINSISEVIILIIQIIIIS